MKPGPTPRDMELFAKTVGVEIYRAITDHLDSMYPQIGAAIGPSCRRSLRSVAIIQARASIVPPKESK